MKISVVFFIYYSKMATNMIRAIDRKHDYVRMDRLFNKIVTMIEKCDSKKIDGVEAYVYNWIDFMTVAEGYDRLFKWYNTALAYITGAYGYHKRFLDSLNFKIGVIDDMLEDKKEELLKSKSTVGFTKSKTNKIKAQ